MWGTTLRGVDCFKKIENEYKLGSDQNLREWIYGGVDRINGILETIAKFKNGVQIAEAA